MIFYLHIMYEVFISAYEISKLIFIINDIKCVMVTNCITFYNNGCFIII